MNLQKFVLYVFVILLFFRLTDIHAQESINATGDNISSTNGIVCYSVGQIANSLLISNNNFLSEGVQQSYEISTVTEVENISNINLNVYPNPTSNVLNLKVEASNLVQYNYLLFNIGGRVIQKDQITNGQTQICMENLISATYFLTIFQDKKKIKTFKILKQ